MKAPLTTIWPQTHQHIRPKMLFILLLVIFFLIPTSSAQALVRSVIMPGQSSGGNTYSNFHNTLPIHYQSSVAGASSLLSQTPDSTYPYPKGYSPSIISINSSGFDGDSQTSDPVTGWGDDAWEFNFSQATKITVEVDDCCLVGDNYEIYITRNLTHSEDLIGTTPRENMNGTTLSSGVFSKEVAKGKHYITIRDPGGIALYNQGFTQYSPAGYHVHITAQNKTQIHPMIFVHGIGEDVNSLFQKDDFGVLYNTLKETYTAADIQKFTYIDDKSMNGLCQPNGCLSQSAVLSNAVNLAKQIQQLYQSSGKKKVTLFGYSMGAAIIRTILAGCPSQIATASTPGCGNVAALIDNVFFIEGVQQGSWAIADKPLQTQIVDSQHLGDLSSINTLLALNGLGIKLIENVKNLHPNYPAEQDLQPESANVKAHNTSQPPGGIHYYNFYGNIQVSLQTQILTFSVNAPETVSIGDLIILPGTDNPTDTSLSGGSRFCLNCSNKGGYLYGQPDSQTSYTEWALTDVIPWNEDLLLKYLEFPGVDPLAQLGTIGKSPVMHIQIGTDSSLNSIKVADSSGDGGLVTIPQEILLHLEKGDSIEP